MTAAPRRAGPVCPAVTGVGIRLPARRCRADGTSYPKGICSAALHCGTPSPTRGSTYRPVGRGPRAPPKNAYPAAGHMGPALQGHTPQKNNAAPLAGRRAFSVHVWHRRRRVIFAAFTSGNRGGNQPKLFNRSISPATVLHTIAVMTLVFSSTTKSGRTFCHCIRLLIDYIGRIHKAREIFCDFGKAMQSDQAGVAAAIDRDRSFRLRHGVICGIVGGDYRKAIGR